MGAQNSKDSQDEDMPLGLKRPIPRNDSNPHLKRFTAYMESNESKENVELRADEGAIVVKGILEKQEIVVEETNNNEEVPEVTEVKQEEVKVEAVEEVKEEVVEAEAPKSEPVEEVVEAEAP